MGTARELDTSEKMYVHLSTEARAEDKENVKKTIYKMKNSESFEKKVKSLSGVLNVDLAQTYAFLLTTTPDDPRVAKLTQPGLQKMIARRCTQHFFPLTSPGQPGLSHETSSFLGQLLLGELLRRMKQEATSQPKMEARQEVSLEALLRTLQQQH